MITNGKSALVLAPMEGVTDAPMRELLCGLGGFDFCVSEFFRISQDVPPARVFFRHVPELRHGSRTRNGTPVLVQLLGGDSEKLARAAGVAIQAGSPGIDLNFGCPAPTVNRHDGGATLLKYPDRIRGIVRAVREAVPAHLSVSAKLRLGWDDPSAILRNAEEAISGGASWITIHARTKMQGYQPPAFWEWIGKVRAASPIPVIANGDIWSLEDFERCREITGCEHFMLGRSALADPWLGLKIRAKLAGENSETRDFSGWFPLIEKFVDLSGGDTAYSVRRIKQWLRYAAQRRPDSGFQEIKRAQSVAEIFQSLCSAQSK